MAAADAFWAEALEALGRYVRRRVADPAAAEDLVQEVALRALQRGPEPGERLRPWLYRTARNAVVDYYRARRPAEELPPDLLAEEPAEDSERLLAACVRPLLAGLPSPYREALERVELEGLDQKALAREAGLSPSGARTRVQRARALFRRRLDECCRTTLDRRGGVAEVEWSPCPSTRPCS